MTPHGRDQKPLRDPVLPRPALRAGPAVDTAELDNECRAIAEDDEAGQRWSEENDYPGYTSYASLADLPWRSPVFARLKEALDAHVAAFAERLEWDLGGGTLELEDLWINILPEGGTHSSHIHPHSVISGTTYVAIPEGAARAEARRPALGPDDGRPAAPRGRPRGLRLFVYMKPAPGEVFLWESWLRHEVPLNLADDEERISVSFNYKWV